MFNLYMPTSNKGTAGVPNGKCRNQRVTRSLSERVIPNFKSDAHLNIYNTYVYWTNGMLEFGTRRDRGLSPAQTAWSAGS
eukprot:SAG11_NODE_821_length_7010_cov_9.308783_2_plen_80_part_00